MNAPDRGDVQPRELEWFANFVAHIVAPIEQEDHSKTDMEKAPPHSDTSWNMI